MEDEILKENQQILATTSFRRKFALKTCKNLKVEVIDVKDRHDKDVWQMEAENQEAKVIITKVI